MPNGKVMIIGLIAGQIKKDSIREWILPITKPFLGNEKIESILLESL